MERPTPASAIKVVACDREERPEGGDDEGAEAIVVAVTSVEVTEGEAPVSTLFS
jgi:hypothetical protein